TWRRHRARARAVGELEVGRAAGRCNDSVANDLPGAGDHPYAVAAAALGLVQRRVGLGERRLELEAPGLRGGDAERDRDLVAVDRRLADRLAQSLGDLGRDRRARPGEQHDELLAAEAVDRLEGANRRLQAPRDLLEDRVAGGVAVLVVDRLEAIDVADD